MITGNEKPIHGGLTILQQFAMAAMQGILSGIYTGSAISKKMNELSVNSSISFEDVVSLAAIEHAKSLIKELNKEL